ncbi:MAG: hypothetical protein IJ597_05740, partial [Synergistaceae bacterium]|nr:hypothetical protein [Synergistaceae bacterium]
MHTLGWYISDSVSDVLAQVIGDMASALRSHSRDIDLQVISAKDKSISGFEKIKNVFAKKEIWHLFGRAPYWWQIIRFHSRTVHTRLEGTDWAGYPSRFFTEGALNGEAVIFPVFDPLSSQSEDVSKAVFVRSDTKKIPAGDYEVVNIAEKILRPEALSGLYIAEEATPREAMRAGILTMRGLAIASPKSGWLDEILGPDGYFLIQDDDDLPRIIRQGLADRGRHMAIAARHFLKSRRSHERCTDSLITL